MAMKPKKVISSRGEVGVGGSARGAGISSPKSAVKVVPKGSAMQNNIKNNIATANAQRAKSGLEAKATARQVMTGKPKARIKINSATRRTSGNR
jgi:hypothetical protein